MYDTTLRDGSQAEGISFSVEDKLKIVKRLDEFGVSYIEAGNPGSNPKDLEFFNRVKKMSLNISKLTAFGSTRRANVRVEDDSNVAALLKADTEAVTVFGKSSDFHVKEIIRTTLEENLSMISDTIRFFKDRGKEVIYDAEHFFDGFKSNSEYALQTVIAAQEAGADWIVLCDTNGGCLLGELKTIIEAVKNKIEVPIGIHCHDDAGLAVANSLLAVEEGAAMIQGTINGYGERCGNVNLCSVIPNLQLKMKKYCIPAANLANLTALSRFVSEIVNLTHDEKMPYVGNSAFGHKGGMHIDAILKNSESFEHVSPELVGNERRILMSEVSGRSTILSKIKKEAPWVTKDSPEVHLIIERLKCLEYEGYQFEGAEASFTLLIKRALGRDKNFFQVKDFRVFGDRVHDEYSSLAVVKVQLEGKEELTVAEGDGPVNALDNCLRKALKVFYPNLDKMRLTDYKVRVLDTSETTAATVRVLIESTDGESIWSTIGVSTNIIEASWFALIDSIEYFLYKQNEKEAPEYCNEKTV